MVTVYGWLWRTLPGPTAVRVLQVAVLAAGVVAACFLWLFPAIAPYLPLAPLTVEEMP